MPLFEGSKINFDKVVSLEIVSITVKPVIGNMIQHSLHHPAAVSLPDTAGAHNQVHVYCFSRATTALIALRLLLPVCLKPVKIYVFVKLSIAG